MEEGTRNCAIEAALSKNELSQLIQAGREKTREISGATDAIVLGEVGIGNTTVSSLMLCALTGESPERCCGAGATTSRTVDHGVVNKKIEIVRRALANYNASQDSPSHSKDAANILRWFGGAEITCIGEQRELDVEEELKERERKYENERPKANRTEPNRTESVVTNSFLLFF